LPELAASFLGGVMNGHPLLLIDAKLAHENTENLLEAKRSQSDFGE
jgi:hypothetical protein